MYLSHVQRMQFVDHVVLHFTSSLHSPNFKFCVKKTPLSFLLSLVFCFLSLISCLCSVFLVCSVRLFVCPFCQLSIYIYLYLSIYPSVPVSSSVHPLVCLSVICMSVYLSLPVCVYLFLSVCHCSVSLSVCPSVSIYFCLSVCLRLSVCHCSVCLPVSLVCLFLCRSDTSPIQ